MSVSALGQEKVNNQTDQTSKNRWRKRETSNLFGTAFKHHILLTLVQPSLSHGPEVQDPILPLQ